MVRKLTGKSVLELWMGAMVILVAISLVGPTVLAQDAPKKDTGVWRVSPRKARMQNPIPANKPSIALGKKIYEKECLECHGKTGKGDGPEATDLEKEVGDFTDPKMWEQTDGALFWKTTIGRKPMPGFRKLLTKEERWHAVNYMRTFAPRKD